MGEDGAVTQGAPPPAPLPGASPWTLDWFRPPGGGRLRYGHVKCAEAKGTLLLFMGRCEYLGKYDEVAGEWRERGFQVFALEWRGQGLSDRPLDNRHKCHVEDYAVHALDLGAWLETVVRPLEVGPSVVFAHSMGGLIALRALAAQPDRFAGAVLSAPMVEINTDPFQQLGAKLLARAACALGYGGAYAFGQGDYHPEVDAVFEGNLITADPERFRRIHDGYRANPRLMLGGVTFGWLAASFRAQAGLLRPEVLRGAATPVLLLIPGEDKLVPPAALGRFGRALPLCAVKEYPGARHDLMSEREAIRQRVWGDIDDFLNQTLPRSGIAAFGNLIPGADANAAR